MSRNLTPAQIDQAIRILTSKDGEYVSRSRSGDGFGSRGGQLYRVSVEENDREEYPVSEADLRTALGALDLDNNVERYAIGALQQMGIDVTAP